MNKEKLKEKITSLKWAIQDSWGWVVSLWIYLFRNIERPGVFRGYAHYKWACMYANKRHKLWKSNWDQAGKQQGIFPVEEIKLLVCSKLELKYYKKNGMVQKNLNPRKAIRKSYYKTQ